MKILIENISIFTASPSKKFIGKGYLYIDKGIVVALGEGDPPPELEFADYIIDGSYSVAMPGFVVGLGNILDYVFRFDQLAEKKNDIVSTLSLSDIQAIFSISLASLALNGVTSIATYVNPYNQKILSGLALAASECWLRLRLIIPVDNVDTHIVEDAVRNTIRGLKDPEAVSKGIVSFGFYLEKKISRDIIELARSLNIKLYVDASLLGNELLRSSLKDVVDVIVVAHLSIDDVGLPIKKTVTTNVKIWRPGVGLVSFNPLNLNPRIFIPLISKEIEDPRTVLDILCHYNPHNLDLGVKAVEDGVVADIVILNFSRPPTGPIPISETNIVKEIALASYAVETTIVAGELTLDQGVTLNVGDKHVKKVQSIFSSLANLTL